MALYALSDLHLSLTGNKPMEIFGSNWKNHDKVIKENWDKCITEEDTVIIAGDLSWSLKMSEGLVELDWINELKGNKIIVKGNHDYWWSSISKLNKLYDKMNFIQNNFFAYEDVAICGTRGWICKGSDRFNSKDEKIYNRELIRLKLSLDSAKNAGYNNIIVAMHYPPVNEKFEESEFTHMFKEYGVKTVIYGHLHGPFNYKIFEGEVDGINYILSSCDYINFNPIKIM